MQINLINDINTSYIPFFKSTCREIVIYGGAGAGKSYATAQKIILYCLLYKEKKIFVIRKTLPALKLTALELLENLLNQYKIPHELNRSDWILKTINGNRIIFKSLDDPQKIKSITDVDFIWLEEATELTEQDFQMVKLRLRGHKLLNNEYRQIVLTFNPVDKNHWIYNHFFLNDRGEKMKYTYKDNRFLDEEFIKELEALKDQNENLYRVYCLGEWGTMKSRVFDNYMVIKSEEIPPGDYFDTIIYGLDFGYNNPSACVEVGLKENEVWVLQEFYKSKLTNSELIDHLKSFIRENADIYADPSEPARIEELYRAGYNIYPASKNVKDGIDFLKRMKIFIAEHCIFTIKEISGYSYKEDKNGNILEEPVKFNDHTVDALRYAVYSHLSKGQDIFLKIL